jgi:hypothetical protein
MKKMKKLIFATCIITIAQFGISQSQYQKVSKIIESLGNIRIETQNIRNNADSVGIFVLLDSLDIITNSLENHMNKVVINDKKMETDISAIDTFNYDEKITEESTNQDGNSEYNQRYNNRSDYYSRLMNVGKRNKIYFELQHGFVGIKKDATILNPAAKTPNHETTSSTYWDFALKVRNSLGDSSSLSFIYGLGYGVNGFTNDNNMRLTLNNDKPEFVDEQNLRNDATFKVGYIYVPLELEIGLTRKIRFTIGGFGGYRVHTNQILKYKIGNEKIDTERSGNYAFNNWNYGGSANLSFSNWGLGFKYHASPLFQENTNFNYNTYSLGFSVKL